MNGMNGKPRILVVDDILANRRLASKILVDTYTVDTVKSGEEAIDYLTKQQPDLVLLDIKMEGIDGFETLTKIRQHKATADLPVIFLTADDDHETETKGFKAGAMDFIVKPFVPVVMKARVARAIELSDLRKKLKADARMESERREKLSLQTIKAMTEIIEWRSQTAKGHSQRSAEYSWQIAEHMGVDSKEREKIYYMALLHDVGKLALPDDILKQGGPSTPAQQEIVQQSIMIGSNILKGITELPEIWEGAYYYKENYDGTGFPQHLKGKDIPMEVRIITAGCVYDKMTCKESGLSQAEARQEMEARSGTRLDPQVVKAVLELMDADVGYNWREH